MTLYRDTAVSTLARRLYPDFMCHARLPWRARLRMLRFRSFHNAAAGRNQTIRYDKRSRRDPGAVLAQRRPLRL